MASIVKLVVYVPAEAEEKVRLALGKAGAGKIGRYDYCSFVSDGVGHYRPLTGTKPYKGTLGRIAEADEYKVETVCYEHDLPTILQAMRKAHPYEEIAYDIIPLLNDKYSRYVPKKR
jgi:hypothetical protein